MPKLCFQTATIYLAQKSAGQQFGCVQLGGSAALGQAQLIFAVVHLRVCNWLLGQLLAGGWLAEMWSGIFQGTSLGSFTLW